MGTEEDSEQTFEKDIHEAHEDGKKAKHVKHAKKETSEKTSENATHVAHEDNKKTTHAKKNAPVYNDLGTGKCVVNGEDPEYEYLDGQGSDCEDLCTGSVDCYGYSVSSSNNCLLWTEPGLSGGGEEWGGANCHVKHSAPSYHDLGTGTCVLNGEDPKYEYLDGGGSECEDVCTGNDHCHGYSVSSYNNCLLWMQPGLSGGGEEWGGAHCHVKRLQGIKNLLELFSGSLRNGTGQKTETALTEEDSEQTFEKDIHEAHEDGKKAKHVKHAKKETSEKTSENATHVAHEDNKKTTHAKKNAPAYNDLGTGKCVVNGEDPEYAYLDGQGSDCEDLCTGSVDCYGYSVSSSNNCLLWTEPGLSGGGEEWGGAN